MSSMACLSLKYFAVSNASVIDLLHYSSLVDDGTVGMAEQSDGSTSWSGVSGSFPYIISSSLVDQSVGSGSIYQSEVLTLTLLACCHNPQTSTV